MSSCLLYTRLFFNSFKHLSFFTESGVTNGYFKKAQQELNLSNYHAFILENVFCYLSDI